MADLDGDGKPDLLVGDLNSYYFYSVRNIGTCTGNCGAISTASNFATGNAPQSIVIGDFNHDGKLDLATANNSANTVSVALGGGDGSFQTAVDYAAGNGPRAVTAADLNGDVNPDLVVADSSANQVSVLLGNANGTFQAATTFGAGTAPHGVATGDFNRDGKVDLVVANSGSNDVSVLLGNGDGSFQTAVSYAAGTTPEFVASGDFNRDGKLDIVVANSGSNNVSVLFGNGDGTFQTATTYAAGTNPLAIAVADLNHDGKLDIAVANSGSGDVSVLAGNGSGSFAAAVNYTAGTAPYSIAAADLNGDGTPDLAVALNGANAVAVIPAVGGGAFGSATSFATGTAPYAVAAADVNRDGKTDLVVANSGTNNISVLLNTCPSPDLTVTVVHNGTFTQGDSGKTYTITVKNSGATATTGTIAVADTVPVGFLATAMSGSGWTCAPATLTCSRSDSLASGASFPPVMVTVNVASNAAPSATNTAVVSGGGELNTLNDTATDTVSVAAIVDLTISMTHTGSFTQGTTGRMYTIAVTSAGRTATAGQITVTDNLPFGLTATAISGAGWNCTLGTLTCTRSDSLTAGSPAPPITLTVSVATNAPPSVMNTATVSGGGEAITSNDTAFDPTTIWAAQTCGTFTAPNVSSAGYYPYRVAKGDFNHDGLTDLAVVSGSYGGNGVMILLGTGGGLFATPVMYPTGNSANAVVTGDLNGDGNLDVVVTNYADGTVSVLLGVGDGTFAPAITTASGFSTYSSLDLVLADFDGDGVLDVVTYAQSGNNAYLLRGNGNGTLQGPVNVLKWNNSLTALRAADVNGDGRMDLVATDYYTNILVIKGNGDGTFQAPTTITVNYYANFIYPADLNGDGKIDLILSYNYSGTIAVLMGNGDGTFQSPINYSAYNISRLAVDDLNGDGNLDVVGVGGSNTISVFYGNGDGTLQPPVTFNDNTYNYLTDVVIGDFNKDGLADIAIVNNSYSGSVHMFLGGCPDLSISKSHTGNFTAGTTNSYTILVSNVGGNSVGTVTVTDTLPDGLSMSNMTAPSPWTCDATNARCTTTQGIAGGSSYPPITVTVNVAKTAANSVINQANVYLVRDNNASNNVAYDGTTVLHVPDVTITKSHNGSFAPGQSGTYTLTVTNVGSGPTTSSVIVTDNLPAGLTPAAMNGQGWLCTLGSLICTREDVLAAGAAFPPITLTVNVLPSATSLTNTATVSNTGDSNTSNNTASDPTTILVAPTFVDANAVASSEVTVTWHAVPGASMYQILRSTDAVTYTVVGTTSLLSFTDPGLTANSAYFYRVRAADTTTLGALSDPDLAMTISFSNDPITPGATPIRAVHITEIRNAINILRSVAGFSPATFTDPSLTGKPIKAVHLTELQTMLNQVRGALGLSPAIYTSQPSTGTPVYGVAIRDLRIGLK